MAAGWTVVRERVSDSAAIDSTAGKSLLYYQHHIDHLAHQLGLAKLSEFFSRDPQAIAQYMRDQGVEPDLDALPDEEWFEPEEGLASVRGLLSALREDPTTVPEPTKIIADLEAIEAALDAAVVEGVRFHLGRELPRLEAE